jgi:hypothetical protein
MGQTAPAADDPRRDEEAINAASPLLPGEHWAVAAARRVEALGLAEHLPAQRAVPRSAVARALHQAALRAAAEAPELADLTHSLVERFREEFPESRNSTVDRQRHAALLGSALAGGYIDRAGLLAPGTLFDPPLANASSIAPEHGAVLRALVAVRVAPFLAAVIEPEYEAGEAAVRAWDVIGGLGPVSLSVGRQPIGYGDASGGSVVISETILDRVQVQTAHPLRFPGWLGVLGPASFHTFLSRFSERRHPGDPFFFGFRGAIQPHPRLTLSAQRASMFGGDSTDVPATPYNVARMMLGFNGGYGFDNQVLSAGFRYRLPTDRVLPLTAYGEWGADDAAGAWRDVPARLAGLWIPAVPLLPELSIGLERAVFAESCCGNPEWYRHFSFRGHWATGHRPLGHGVGGHGSEWLLYGGADLLGAKLRLNGRIFQRERGEENLYAPDRTGRSRGVAVHGAWRFLPRAELQGSVYRDAGREWSEREFQLLTSIFF